MAVFAEGRSLAAETEPLALLTEGAAGIAVIVLTIIGLANISPGVLAAIATLVIGVGLMVQGFNTAAEYARALAPIPAAGQTLVTPRRMDVGGDVTIQFAAGITGVVLGVLGVLGINASHLIPAALIVFGGALMLAGAISLARPPMAVEIQPGMPAIAPMGGSAGASGIEIVVGIAAIILGILTLVFMGSWVLTLVGLLAIGVALLVISATFGGAVARLFLATA